MMSLLDVQIRNRQKSCAVQNPVNNRNPALGNKAPQSVPITNTRPGLLPFPILVPFNIVNSSKVGYCVPYHKGNWNMVQPASNKPLGFPQLSPLTVNTNQKPAVKNEKNIPTLSSALGSSLVTNSHPVANSYNQPMANTSVETTNQSYDPRQQYHYGQNFNPQQPSIASHTNGQQSASRNQNSQPTVTYNHTSYGQPMWDNGQVQHNQMVSYGQSDWDNGPIQTWSNEEATTSRQQPMPPVDQHRNDNGRREQQGVHHMQTNEPTWSYEQCANTYGNQQGQVPSTYLVPESHAQHPRFQETRNNDWNQQRTTVQEPYYDSRVGPMASHSVRQEGTENVYFLDLTVPQNGRSVADSIQILPRKSGQQYNGETMSNSNNGGSMDQRQAYNMTNSGHPQNGTNYSTSQDQHNSRPPICNQGPNEYPVTPVVGYTNQPMQNAQQIDRGNLVPMLPNPCYEGPAAAMNTTTTVMPAQELYNSSSQSNQHMSCANINAHHDNLVPNPGYVGPPVQQQQAHPIANSIAGVASHQYMIPAPQQYEQVPYPYGKPQYDGGGLGMVPKPYYVGPSTQPANMGDYNCNNYYYENSQGGQNMIPMGQQYNIPTVQVNHEMVNWSSQQGNTMVQQGQAPLLCYSVYQDNGSWRNQQNQYVAASTTNCLPQTGFQETSQQCNGDMLLVPPPDNVVNSPVVTCNSKWEQSPPVTSGYVSMNAGNSVSPQDARQGIRVASNQNGFIQHNIQPAVMMSQNNDGCWQQNRNIQPGGSGSNMTSVKANEVTQNRPVVETMQSVSMQSKTKSSSHGKNQPAVISTQKNPESDKHQSTVPKDSVKATSSSLTQPVAKEMATCHDAETAACYPKTNPTALAPSCAFKNTRPAASRLRKPTHSLNVTPIAYPGKIVLTWDHPKSKEAITYCVICYDEKRVMIRREEFVIEAGNAVYEMMSYSGREYFVHMFATQMKGRCLMAEWKDKICTGFPISDTSLYYTQSLRAIIAHREQPFSSKEFFVVYRFEEEQRVNDICMHTNFRIKPYAIRSVRGGYHLEGTHFFLKTSFDGGLPTVSTRGGVRLHFAAPTLLSPERHRFYFADYDGKRAFIVICSKKSPSNDYCSRHLICLDPFNNPFLRVVSANGMQRFFATTAFNVNIIYSEDLDIRIGQMEAVQVYTRP